MQNSSSSFLLLRFAAFVSILAADPDVCRAASIVLGASQATFIASGTCHGFLWDTHAPGANSDHVMVNPCLDDVGDSRGLLGFNIPSIPGTAIVASATLALYQHFNGDAGSIYALYAILSGWDSETVTYATGPSASSTAVSSLTLPDDAVDVYRTWDVTEIVTAWTKGTQANHGLSLQKPGETNFWTYFVGLGGDVTQQPVLTVEIARVAEPSILVLLGMGGLGAASLIPIGRGIARR